MSEIGDMVIEAVKQCIADPEKDAHCEFRVKGIPFRCIISLDSEKLMQEQKS